MSGNVSDKIRSSDEMTGDFIAETRIASAEDGTSVDC